MESVSKRLTNDENCESGGLKPYDTPRLVVYGTVRTETLSVPPPAS
jgi:hypothetical protein